MVHNGRTKGGTRDYTETFEFAKSNHLAHSKFFTKGGRTYNLSPSSTKYLYARWNNIQLGPDSLPPRVFSINDVFFDIRLTGNGVDTIFDITLRMDISNTSTVPVTDTNYEETALYLLVASYLFNRIEIQPDGGFTQDTQYPDQMLIALWHLLTTEQKACVGQGINMNTSAPRESIRGFPSNTATCDEAAYPLYAGEKKTLFVPLYSMLTQAKIFMSTKDQNPRLRIHCAQNPLCRDSPFLNSTNFTYANNLALEGVNAIVSGVLYSDRIRTKLQDTYMKSFTVSRVLVNERQSLDVKNVVADSEISDLSMTVFNGAYAMFFIYFLQGGAQAEQLYSSSRTINGGSPYTHPYDPPQEPWVRLERLSMTDSDGNPVWYNLVPGDFVRFIASAQNFPGAYVYQEKNLYPFVFSIDAPCTIKTGANTGGMYLDSNFQLLIVPGVHETDPTILNWTPNGSYTLRIDAFRYALLEMDEEGKFNVVKL